MLDTLFTGIMYLNYAVIVGAILLGLMPRTMTKVFAWLIYVAWFWPGVHVIRRYYMLRRAWYLLWDHTLFRIWQVRMWGKRFWN